MLHEQPLEKAARYRRTAEYVADAALTPYLLRMAEDYERQASEGAVIAATSSLPSRGGAWATPA
jgi:hypothetical protein